MLVATCECPYAHVDWVTHCLGFHPLFIIQGLSFALEVSNQVEVAGSLLALHSSMLHWFIFLPPCRYRSVNEKERDICETHLDPVEEQYNFVFHHVDVASLAEALSLDLPPQFPST
jgi:hypothetical protein